MHRISPMGTIPGMLRDRSLCLGNANSNKEVSLGISSVRQPLSGNTLVCNLKCRQFRSN